MPKRLCFVFPTSDLSRRTGNSLSSPQPTHLAYGAGLSGTSSGYEATVFAQTANFFPLKRDMRYPSTAAQENRKAFRSPSALTDRVTESPSSSRAVGAENRVASNAHACYQARGGRAIDTANFAKVASVLTVSDNRNGSSRTGKVLFIWQILPIGLQFFIRTFKLLSFNGKPVLDKILGFDTQFHLHTFTKII